MFGKKKNKMKISISEILKPEVFIVQYSTDTSDDDINKIREACEETLGNDDINYILLPDNLEFSGVTKEQAIQILEKMIIEVRKW